MTAAADGMVDEEPDPLTETPPEDRFCDLVLNGGVASGVVYPWALLELARSYRFRNIGGNSVGAMAAAVAAAAEYGRCTGVENAFEPLRKFPIKLAGMKDDGDPRPQMLRLFQPSASVGRLFKVFLIAIRHTEGSAKIAPGILPDAPTGVQLLDAYGLWWPLKAAVWAALFANLIAALALNAAIGAWVAWILAGVSLASTLTLLAIIAALTSSCFRQWISLARPWRWLLIPLAVVGTLAIGGLAVILLLVAGIRIAADLRALANNDYGLCRGMSQPSEVGSGCAQEEALVEWLHRGIQVSAGRGEEDPPLTFADLWAAPRFGRPGPVPLTGGLEPPGAGIGLQMFASNVTQGRPIRLPLNDPNTQLYYLPEEWSLLFPDSIMAALEEASSPYVPLSRSDPPADCLVEIGADSDGKRREPVFASELRELPSGNMPIVVAARMSLCFPILFTSVPVYAVDYERAKNKTLARCLLSDGGLASNFPVHLFDAAHPRWPTFALLLDKRLQSHDHQKVWLPITHLEGRADNWDRGVPGAKLSSTPSSWAARLGGFLGGLLLTTKDWNDRVTARLPNVRNRVIRLALKQGEGQLNIAMSGATMLRMARDYGLKSASDLSGRFKPEEDNRPSRGWREHLYVRAVIELRALHAHVRGYASAVAAGGDTIPLRDLLDDAMQRRPLDARNDRIDPTGASITRTQRDALVRAISAVETLERELAATEPDFGPYVPVAQPELRLRPSV